MNDSLLISKITFRAKSDDNSNLEISPGNITILVGPNNSGKSLALREIERYCFGENVDKKIIKDIQINYPNDPDEAIDLLKKFKTSPPPNQTTQLNNIWVGQHTFNPNQPIRHYQIDLSYIRNMVSNKNQDILRSHLSSFYTIRLDGRTRFFLVDDKPSGDLLSFPQNHLWSLFVDDSSRQEVKRLIHEAFELHFVIDPTSMTSFRIKLSSNPPEDNNEEQGLSEKSRLFHKNAVHIHEYSDGVQAFVGLISAIFSYQYKIILIDEPEAFLHPPLARRLGSSLGEMISKRISNLFVSTHSADFVMGCLQNAMSTTVIRLTYENGLATAKKMDSSELSSLMNDPLLRSTGTLRALFHRAAIVTESDTDRAFYDEINRRLESVNRGSRDTLFINAQNKQTIYRIVEPLRKLGVPSVAIVDLDIIRPTNLDCGQNDDLMNLLNSCGVDNQVSTQIISRASEIYEKFLETEKNRKDGGKELMKSTGIEALDPINKLIANTLINDLRTYGIFIVPVGELESWLANLGSYGKGVNWLVSVFSKMGQPGTTGYLLPKDDDVWKFLDDVSNWINEFSKKYNNK